MNILVVSDSHGKVDKLIQAVEQVHPGYVLHLGDCQRDLEKLRQAEKDGAALVSQAQEAARRAAADALRQAEAQAEAERQAMLDRTEKDCEALRAAAMARMDDAVDYLLEKVVKR